METPGGGTGEGAGAGGSGGGGPATCPAGQALDGDGDCQLAGVPPDLCADGFEPNGRGGCLPVLPAAPCDPGRLALPGDTSCRPVMTCGAPPWGDIPTAPDTQYVDASYGGGSSDGTAAHPWTDLQSGVDAAAPDAVVAVAAGSYLGDVTIMDEPVRLWGRCPELVQIADYLALGIRVVRADGTEVHGLGFTGPAMGLVVSDAVDVLLDQIWVHESPEVALLVQHSNDPAAVTLQDSLIEGGEEGGIVVDGGHLTVSRSVIRHRSANAFFPGRGVDLMPGLDGEPPVGDIVDSVLLANQEVGIVVFGGALTVTRSVVQDTQPRASDGRAGVGIQAQHAGPAAELAIDRSTLVGNHTSGVTALSSTATLTLSTIDDTRAQASDGAFGDGATVAGAGVLAIDRCAISQTARAGVTSFSATVSIGSTALACNPIDLDGEALGDPFSFEDGGMNACFCGADAVECQVRSTNLQPPTPF